MAPEVEEAVADADRGHGEDVLPDLHEPALQLIARLDGGLGRWRQLAGSGSAARSTLPLAASGKRSSVTNAAGTMYSGSARAANSRSSRGSGGSSLTT